MGPVTIMYCLRFETSLFVASYDSQGYMEVFDPASTREFRGLEMYGERTLKGGALSPVRRESAVKIDE
jgi:hypothetical protein